ncbi:MAG: hypothetical protein Greene041619_737 [Candidatus Peregrinibacteria bacterium Greene0416_19]|nr:MAG: hypothetical protein Greene041619_737 [Candidatus Peregrinibacteria bacterium Greene0416_19]
MEDRHRKFEIVLMAAGMVIPCGVAIALVVAWICGK